MQKTILRFTKGTRLAIPTKVFQSARIRTMCHNHPDRKAISMLENGQHAMCGQCYRRWMNEK